LNLIRNQGFDMVSLPMQNDSVQAPAQPDQPPLAHASWLGSDWCTDARQTIAAMNDMNPDWLIVDHYALDARWESHLRSYCKRIMVIDDLADRSHDCDLLMNQNLVADKSEQYSDRVPAQCGMMLGPRYALLQPQYADLHLRVPPREGPVRRVLVYFGGADSSNLTEMAILAFLSLNRKDIVLDVVINPESPHAESIRRQTEGQQNITLYTGLPTLALLMVKSDIAIGAGGTTSWERCCMGLPALVITLAENQKQISEQLDSRKTQTIVESTR
jgi:UDP-2,4-diacetamido-2,4,6-trideoxy-beta-L-altropyranose hydrolase